MSFSIEDMTQPMTTEEVKKSIYDVYGLVGVNVTKWKSGSVLRTATHGVAIVIAGLSQIIAGAARGGFRPLASGSWLRLNTKYVYGVDALDASFASGTVMLSNTSTNVYNNVQPGDLVVRNPTTGKTYRNIAEFSVGSLQVNVPVTVQAIQAGAASTSGANEITEFVTAFPGLVCTNPDAIVGADTERDEDLRARGGAKLDALSPNGAGDVYDFIARGATRPDGTTIGVNRVGYVPPPGDGTLTIVLATASGAVPAPDLAIINELYRTQCEPLGTDVTGVSAVSTPQSVTYTAYISNTLVTDTEAKAAFAEAITEFLSTYPIGGANIDAGGKLYVSALKTAMGAARASAGLAEGQLLGIVRLDITLPAADVALGTTAATVASTITGTIIRVRAGQI